MRAFVRIYYNLFWWPWTLNYLSIVHHPHSDSIELVSKRILSNLFADGQDEKFNKVESNYQLL